MLFICIIVLRSISAILRRKIFFERLPLSKSADYLKKFKWAAAVCAYLEQWFTGDEIREIRMDCSCNESGKVYQKHGVTARLEILRRCFAYTFAQGFSRASSER